MYGLDLEELDLFFSLVLCLSLLDCLPEESFGITYIMHAHEVAKLNKVANLVLISIDYRLLYRIVISVQSIITQRLVDAESLLELTVVKFIIPSKVDQIDAIKLLGFPVRRQSWKLDLDLYSHLDDIGEGIVGRSAAGTIRALVARDADHLDVSGLVIQKLPQKSLRT